ncbi:MAG: hypothetical protein AB8B62_07185 [Roseobacter sp.]
MKKSRIRTNEKVLEKNNMSEKRWPQLDRWHEKAVAIETLAQACGAYVYCSKKHQSLNAEIQRKSSSPEQTKALCEIADMIEKLTDPP